MVGYESLGVNGYLEYRFPRDVIIQNAIFGNIS